MAEVKFHYKVDDSKLSFAVVIARMNCRWVLCKHKDRTTYEFPGGHREIGESIERTARRELQEETGATTFSLKRICDYSVRGDTRQGEELDEETFGTLFFAKISHKDDAINSEIEKVELSIIYYLHASNKDVRYFALKALLNLLPFEKSLCMKYIYEAINNGNFYEKNLIIKHLKSISKVDEDAYNTILGKCLTDWDYYVRTNALKAKV